MTVITVAFPQHRALPDLKATIYQIRWTTERETTMQKSTSDANAVRRQLESCRQRGLLAIVTAYRGENDTRGINCGSVIGHRQRDDSISYSSHFQEIGPST